MRSDLAIAAVTGNLFRRAHAACAVGAFLAVFGTHGCASTPAVSSPMKGSVIDGTWEGALRSGGVSGQTEVWEWGEEPVHVRIVIEGASVRVYLRDGESWRQVDKPFRMRSHRTNAVISAVDDGLDEDGLWVETWNLSVSQVDWRTLQVTMSRQVNNEDMPRSDPDAVWWQFGYGTFALQGVAP